MLFIQILLFCFLYEAYGFEKPKVPQSFGLLTVTHTRNGDISTFMQYLERYSRIQCDIISQINIVWNNQESMEELGVLRNKQSWTKPINFYINEKNSMDLRYKIPPQSKAEVFFNIDDDIEVSCEQLSKSFKIWQQHAVGVLAPIVSYAPRHFQFTERLGFKYGRVKTGPIFTFGLISQSFLSRHYLELYYAEIKEIKKMRELIVEMNNCDDIGLAWIINYYYPELPTVITSGKLFDRSPKVAQSTTPTHFIYREKCIREFINIFGQMSLKYLPKVDSYQGRHSRIQPLKNETVLIRMQYIEKYILKKTKMTYNFTPSQLFQSYFESNPVTFNQDLSIDQQIKSKIEQQNHTIKQMMKERQRLNNELLQVRSQLQLLKRQKTRQVQQKVNIQEDQYVQSFSTNKNQMVQQNNNEVKPQADTIIAELIQKTIYCLAGVVAILIILVLWQLVGIKKLKKRIIFQPRVISEAEQLT